jgi:hypothetical protein
MIKWRLVIKTLPWVLLILGLTYVRQYVLGLQSLVDFGDIGAILTAAALIIGFMLAGVISDYKESERLPGELATTLETVDDAIVAASSAGKPFDARALRHRYYETVVVITDWFMNRGTAASCLQALQSMNELIADLDRRGAGAVFVTRCLAEQHNLRKLVTRIDVIRHTQFIATGYALLQMFVFTTVVLMAFSNFRNWQVQFLVIGTLTLIYVYLLRLIRDLDDPFEYARGYEEGGSADVSPLPVLEYRKRLEASLGVETGDAARE